MDEGTVAVVLALCVACVAFVAWMIEKNSRRLEDEIRKSVHILEQSASKEFPNIDEMMASIEDLIHDTVGSMRTPQIADHLGAILQQWAQVKFAKEMNAMQSLLPVQADEIEPGVE
jgi:hypothetical protein